MHRRDMWWLTSAASVEEYGYCRLTRGNRAHLQRQKEEDVITYYIPEKRARIAPATKNPKCQKGK